MIRDIVATIAAGALVVVLMAAAAARHQGAVRRGAAATAVVYGLWTAGCVALLLGLPDGLFWVAFRPVMFVLLVLAAASSPGAAMSIRELLDVLLDGWLTVGSVFGLTWIVVQRQTVFPDRVGLSPLMLWLVFQILIMCLVGGLFARVVPGHRWPPLIAYLVGLTVLVGDVLALVTNDARLGIPFWLGSGLLMAVSMLVAGGELYTNVFRDPDQPRGMKLWQLPAPYFIAYAFVPRDRTPVVQLITCLVTGAVFAQLILHSRRNERLWGRLRERTRLSEDVLYGSQDVILQLDRYGVVEFANPAAVRVLLMDPAALVGTRLQDHVHPADQLLGREVVADTDWSQESAVQVAGRFRIEGGWRYIEWTMSRRGLDEQGTSSGWIMSGRDVSERIALQAELVDAARTDLLTGLLNRGAFLGAVGARLAGGQAAVLFIDLDDFKAVNDTMGHGQGDEMLRRAAECLRQSVGPADEVARLGGDEFAVLIGSEDPVVARAVAEGVVTAFNGFDEAAAGRPSVSASVGIAAATKGTATELLRDADLAMYRAKRRGGAGLVEFESWMSERVMEQARLRSDLEVAVREESLALYLQPVVDLHTRQWTGFEALVRWPVGRETWSPAQFLPVAEQSGLIVPMGSWVLREALRQLAGWRDNTLGMAVNVSALQLVGTDFFDITMAALAASGVSPDRLTLEITEQAAVQDLGRTASRLEALRSEGVHVAIDDFGTGFSSLQYLSRLPVDILKIDRKFVWGLGQQAEDDVLVRSMLGLAAELGLEVIAEGVETRKQADRLLEYGCRLAQGFLFSPPRPIEELRASDPFVSPALLIPRPRVGSTAASAINSGRLPTEHREKPHRRDQSG